MGHILSAFSSRKSFHCITGSNAAGKAIVCTSVGGNPETVEDGKEALVVPARNSEAIADALVKLIESESLRKKMGHDARERFLRNFTEDIMKKKLCEVLKNATINQNKI